MIFTQSNFLTRLFATFLFVTLSAAGLSACGTAPTASNGGDYFPGGSQYYSYGVSQSKENFANVERAQSYYGMFTKERWWQDIKPGKAPSMINVLQAYYPLDVRWKLKDGREFILEKIDVRAIMREYFKSHKIDMPYQREGRSWAHGDYNPSFVHEVRDDVVVVKWLVRYNHTPLERRDQELPKIEYLEYPVTTIQGSPTSGIDFENWVEIKK